jgi:hypothetical protein
LATRRNASSRAIARASVRDVTERASKACVEFSEVTYVRPKVVVMQYWLAGNVVHVLAVFGVLSLAHHWSLDPFLAAYAMLVLSAPWSMAAVKLFPGVLQQAAGN